MKTSLIQKQHLGIGETIRHFRKKRGMTLQQLADQSGLSASYISLVERGKATPSIVSLMNMAQALKVSIDNFLEKPKAGKSIRRADNPEYVNIDSTVEYVWLSSGLPGRKVDGLKITIPAGFECPKVRRDGESLYFVLKGNVTIIIDGESYNLSEGDSAHVSPRQQYVLSCGGGSPATVLWFGTPLLSPDYTSVSDS